MSYRDARGTEYAPLQVWKIPSVRGVELSENDTPSDTMRLER